LSINCHIIAIGKNRDADLQRLIDEYIKRLSWKITFTELAAPNVSDAERKSREADLLRAAIPPKAVRIFLDERGKNMGSGEFADKLQNYFTNQQSTLAFIIGGADGLDDPFRREADFVISFGALTWPHMMVRLMLVEQLYRASTILDGHPYHRV
jgi:23S rRNA (pseudouridine1915-N3)-methyltransferase